MAKETLTKPFETEPREELEGYARDFGLTGVDAMSDTELRKRLREVQTTTGTAPEADGPVEHRGDPGRGPRH
jgi:hypothetical protein